MRKWIIALAALAVSALPTLAEDLYDQDGAKAWSSARIVTRDAAVCRVPEDSRSEEEYEAIKANEGRPLHLWRIGLTVANYSGKVIERLLAIVVVESEVPPLFPHILAGGKRRCPLVARIG